MRIEEHSPAGRPAPSSWGRRWLPRLLRLYPRAWQERYGDEVTLVLAEHRVTYWTALDLVLGAVDARLHPDLLPRRLTSMAHRIRSSEITIFCAFVLFCAAWLLQRFVRDPLPVWEAAVNVHPQVLRALTLLDLAGVIGTLAILVGGLPLLVSAVRQAVAARRWRMLALFAVPLIAAAVPAAIGLADIPWYSVSQSGAVTMLQSVQVQIALVVLLLLAIGGSAAAIAAAIGRSELNERMLRFALLPAAIATAALALGLFAAITLSALIFTETPQVSLGPVVQGGDLLLMLVAVVLAAAGLQRGVQAARGS